MSENTEVDMMTTTSAVIDGVVLDPSLAKLIKAVQVKINKNDYFI